MDLSLILLISGIAVAVLALVFCAFGYRLGRFLLPLCGLVVLEGALYLFLYDLLALDRLGTWLFFGGSSLAFYIILFFLKRLAGLFAGLLGSAMLLFFIVTALDLGSLPYVYPACLTLCVVAAVLAVAYQKAGVIVGTSLFGGSLCAYLVIYIAFFGVDPADFSVGNILVPLWQSLSANAYLVAGAALVLSVLGIVAQLLWTGRDQVLGNGAEEDHSFRIRRSRRQMEI
jgi:hypothetical protein